MRRFFIAVCAIALGTTTLQAQQWLKQSTAVTVKVGPFVDSLDGNTAKTSLTIQKADVRLSKNGGDYAAANANQGASDAGAPHDELGEYDVSLDATDTNTLGRVKLLIKETGALPVWQEFMIVPANVHDSLVGQHATDTLQTDVTQFGGMNGTFSSGRPEVNLTHAGGQAIGTTGTANLRRFFDGTGYGPVLLHDTITAVVNQTNVCVPARGWTSTSSFSTGLTAIVYDASHGNMPSVRRCTLVSENGSSIDILLETAPSFTVAPDDTITLVTSAPQVETIHMTASEIKTKTDFLPSATAGAAGGLFIAGTNAPVTITGSGNALTLTSTGGNGLGLAVTGNGTGHGALFTSGSGDTGNGIQATAASSDGNGFALTGSGSGFGLNTNFSSLNITDGSIDANVTHWLGDDVEEPTVPGVPQVDITRVLGSPVCD